MTSPDHPPADAATARSTVRPPSPFVRPAVAADAEAIVAVHHAAVHRSACGAYAQEVLDIWSAPPGAARHERMRQVIADGDELVRVVQEGGDVVAFGSIVPRTQELRAVYVHPAAGRRGIGALLLAALETLAREHGLARLQMDASINAEAFYRRAGYGVVERGAHPLRDGLSMDCVRMLKALAA
ncbi:MAG: GNAT family N-acetyltransferase [Rubrivivax sp.]